MLAAFAAMARVLGGDGLGVGDTVLLLCFAAMLPWNVHRLLERRWSASPSCAAAAIPLGRVLPAGRSAPSGPIRARVAIVMPVHNEDPERVLRHLEQTVASLDATGESGRVRGVPAQRHPGRRRSPPPEAGAVRALAAAGGAGPSRLHYRRRRGQSRPQDRQPLGLPRAHGQRFDHMLVLDADSVMSGAAIVRLVRMMEGQPEIGILQQLIVGLPNTSPFPRIFQFGMRHGMRAYTVGSAWWQGDCGPYWGHNALIRIAPFMAHCRLPLLPGRPPLGGRVLSHDQVEAVLMRRAGWQVRVLPDEDGSFEENPPTLSDFVKRDLRWCQGNWQYVHLVARPGLHAIGRLQLWLAILMYVSGPAWVLFSAGGLGPRHRGRPRPRRRWPCPLARPAGRLGRLDAAGGMLTLVFAPKLAGVPRSCCRRRCGAPMAAARAGRLEPGRAAVLVRPGADHGGGPGGVRAGPRRRADHPLGSAAA